VSEVDRISATPRHDYRRYTIFGESLRLLISASGGVKAVFRFLLWLSRYIPGLSDKISDGVRKAVLASPAMSKLKEAALQQPALAQKLHLTDGPDAFIKLDNDMCAHFGVNPDPNEFYKDWLGILGWRIALGSTWDEIRSEFHEMTSGYPAEAQDLTPPYLRIIDWLEQYSQKRDKSS
jgi:hypothetical protein